MKWREVRQAFREQPHLWNDVIQAALILFVAVVSTIAVVNLVCQLL